MRSINLETKKQVNCWLEATTQFWVLQTIRTLIIQKKGKFTKSSDSQLSKAKSTKLVVHTDAIRAVHSLDTVPVVLSTTLYKLDGSLMPQGTKRWFTAIFAWKEMVLYRIYEISRLIVWSLDIWINYSKKKLILYISCNSKSLVTESICWK